MSLQRGSDVKGWSGVTKNLAANNDERAAWRFSTASLLLALFATGIAALLLAQVDIPVISKAVLAMGVLLFTTVLISGVYSTMINRAVDENLDNDRPTARKPTPAPKAEKRAPVAAPVQAEVTKPEPASKPAPASKPVVVASAEEASPGMRPAGLDAARNGVADDLTLIKGVGPKMAQLCNSLGFYHFDQIAGWTAEEVAWVDDNLEGFKGRVSRDDWVAQAKVLAAGGETEFSARQS